MKFTLYVPLVYLCKKNFVNVSVYNHGCSNFKSVNNRPATAQLKSSGLLGSS